MIYSLNGELVYSDALSSTAVIECAGVGYKLTVTSNTMTRLPLDGANKNIRLLTHMQVREDAVELYGFYSKEELDMFRLLISVSGVGPKAAMSILSLFTPDKLALAVASEDTKAISRAPGVGGKTAARVVLELKDKLAKEFGSIVSDSVTNSPKHAAAVPVAGNKMKDAQEALTVLGYSRSEIVSVLSKIDMSKDLEEIIRLALAALLRQ